MNNSETFTKVLEINYANFEKIEVYFSFIGSGSAKIIKKSNDRLLLTKSINRRNISIKNTLRKLL